MNGCIWLSDTYINLNYISLYFQEDGDSVGFATLPEQVHRKAIKRGFDFTIMVVGK